MKGVNQVVRYLAYLAIACLVSCTSLTVNQTTSVNIPAHQRIAVLPFVNTTETPQADERAAAIATDLLRTKGAMNIVSYPMKGPKFSLIPGVKAPVAKAKLLHWARKGHARFALTGSVTEWNYKVGLDGEPAIGLTLELIDVQTGRTIWSAVGSKSGGSRAALSSVAQELLSKMMRNVILYR